MKDSNELLRTLRKLVDNAIDDNEGDLRTLAHAVEALDDHICKTKDCPSEWFDWANVD